MNILTNKFDDLLEQCLCQVDVCSLHNDKRVQARRA